MDILYLADALNKPISIKYHPNQDGRFTVSFDGLAEIVGDGVLTSAYGDGKNAIFAMNNYTKSIQGKRLRFDGDKSQEFDIPKMNSVYWGEF